MTNLFSLIYYSLHIIIIIHRHFCSPCRPSQQNIYYLHIVFGCHSAMTNLFSIYYSFHIIIIIIIIRRHFFRRAAVMAVRRHSCSTYYSHIIFGCHSTMTNLFSLIYYSLHIIIIICCYFCSPCRCDSHHHYLLLLLVAFPP